MGAQYEDIGAMRGGCLALASCASLADVQAGSKASSFSDPLPSGSGNVLLTGAADQFSPSMSSGEQTSSCSA